MTPEQLELRRNLVTCSRLPAILGKSPFAQPIDVYNAMVYGETGEANDESRKIVSAAGLDANEMMPDGFSFRFILGDNRDAIVDQKTGETLPLAHEAEKQEKVAQQAPQADNEEGKAPYPDNWPERRKAKVPGYEETWSNTLRTSVKFLETLKKKGNKEAAHELVFREANDIK